MFVYDAPFWGMHVLWWVFWIVVWASFFSFLTPVPRRHFKRLMETPRDALLRRFARGELNEADYERAKAIIERDGRREGDQMGPAGSGSLRPLTT